MQRSFHIRCGRFSATSVVRFLRAGSLVITLLAGFASAALAQNSPTQPIGRIEGADVTVDSGMPATVATRDTPASIYVSNGSVLTVHSGKARLLLLKGGELDICGPAKFTMLTSGNDITLALNFGRVHVQLPAKTSLKIFSPTIIATPIDINGGSRDVTIGLDVNDSLCVLATSGAIQLEHQFTGERLIVPQAGEFFLNDGTLVPVAGKAGSCGCTPMAEHPAPRAPARIPEFARAAPAQPEVTPEMPPPPASVRAAEARSDSPTTQTVQPGAVFVIPVHPEDEHPLALSEGQSAGEAPQIDGTLHGDVTPALSFMANAPQPPTDAEPEMMLLVSEAREAPDWQFDGHVDAPQFAKAMRQALGEESAATGASPSDNPSTRPAKKKRGFWGALKGLFFGNVEAAGPAK